MENFDRLDFDTSIFQYVYNKFNWSDSLFDPEFTPLLTNQ
jgi:hypothetical protein